MNVATRPASHAHPGHIPSTRSYPAALFVSIVAIGLFLRFYWVISKYSVNLFFWDEWDIYGLLFEHAHWWQIFVAEHGPPREGLGVVIVSGLLGLTHWNSRVQAFAIGAAIVLAMVLTIRLKLRVFGPLTITDAIIPALFLGLGQWEVLVSAPGPSAQAFPLLLIMAYCISWLQECRFLRYALVIVINFVLIYTGYGIFIAGITLALFALDCLHRTQAGDVRGATASLLAATIAAASLASFFYHYLLPLRLQLGRRLLSLSIPQPCRLSLVYGPHVREVRGNQTWPAIWFCRRYRCPYFGGRSDGRSCVVADESKSSAASKPSDLHSHQLYVDLCVCSSYRPSLFRDTGCAVFPQHDIIDSSVSGDLFPSACQTERRQAHIALGADVPDSASERDSAVSQGAGGSLGNEA